MKPAANRSDRQRRVVVVGSLNLDLVVRAGRLPLPGETVLGDGFAVHEGGKGGNQAVAAARMGAAVAMLGCIGADAHGERLRQALQGDGIDVEALVVDPQAATGVATITVAHEGENCIVVVSGANHALQPAHIDAAAALIGGAAVLVAQLETPLATVLRALQIARRAGVITLLNAAPLLPLPPQTLGLVDWLIVNENEAHGLSGLPVDDVPQAQRAAEALRAQGARQVVLTLGAGGIVHADANGARHAPALSAQAVDSTGAGDTFVGSLAAGLALGLSAAEALRQGQAAAAISVTRHGAQPSMPMRAEVQARLLAT